MGYKILGYVVWKGAKLVAKRKYGSYVPSRQITLAGFVAVLVAAVAIAAARREASS
jgi:hypothetical protein